MEDIFNQCESVLTDSYKLDDKERYLKMAIRIDPTDTIILNRKRIKIICKMIANLESEPKRSKVGCTFPMAVVSILLNAEFRWNDHREDVPHFSISIVYNMDSYISYGIVLFQKQTDLDPTLRDYGFIEYLKQSVLDNGPKESVLCFIRSQESKRDYYTASLRQVNNLIQIDEKPNLELMEPKWELYKVSISFQPMSKFQILIDLDIFNLT